MSKRTAEGFTTLNDILDEDGIREEAEREARSMSKDVKVEQRHRDAAVELAHALGMTAEQFTSGAADTIAQAFARFESTLRAPDAREVVALIDELNERKSSREFYGIGQALHSKLCTIRLSLLRQPEQGREGKYLVWSNEHRAWWAPERRGYTRSVERAGRYDRDEAISISSIRGGGWPNEGNPYELAIPEADAVAQALPSAPVDGDRA